MSVRLHRPGIWQVRVYRGYDPTTGRRRFDAVQVHGTRADALRVEVEMRAGTYRPPERTPVDPSPAAAPPPGPESTVDDVAPERTVADVVGAVIDHLEVIGRAPSTIRGYRGIARGIARDEIARRKWAELTTREVDEYYGRLRRGETTLDGEPMTPKTIRHYHALLRTSAGWAVRWEWAPRNVVRDASPPTVHARRVVSPASEDVAAVIRTAEAADRSGVRGAGLRLLSITGVRLGEVVALRWSDVDLDAGTVRVHQARDTTPGAPLWKATKTHSARVVPLGAGSVRWLRSWRAAMLSRAMAAGARIPADAFLLSDSADCTTPLHPDRLTRAAERARQKAGVSGVSPLTLRHWAATQWLDAGLDPVVVAGILGHADPSTTRRFYAAATPEALTRAGEIMAGRLAELG